MRAVELVATLFHALVFGIATGGYLALAWSPFLLLRRLRRLFEIGPTTEWWTNYLLSATGFGIVHVSLGLFIWFTFDPIAPIIVLTATGTIVALTGMAIAGVILPSMGLQWANENAAMPTAIALLGSAIWYIGVSVIPPFVLWTMTLAQ